MSAAVHPTTSAARTLFNGIAWTSRSRTKPRHCYRFWLCIDRCTMVVCHTREYARLVNVPAPPVELATPIAGGSLALQAARDPDAKLATTQATPAAAFRAARRMYLKGRRL